MGNKTSLPQVKSSYDKRISSASTSRSFVKCQDISSENYYCDTGITNINGKANGRKSSITFEPQINNILLSINRDTVKPSAYKRKNVKSKKGIKIISSLSRSKNAKNKNRQRNLNAVNPPELMPTFSDITTATSRSSNITTEVKSTTEQISIPTRKRVGLRRENLIHTKEIIDPLIEPSQEASLLRCMDQSPHAFISQDLIVKQKGFLKSVHRQVPPLTQTTFLTHPKPDQNEHEKRKNTDDVNFKSSGTSIPEGSSNYELLNSFAEDENHFLEESSHTTENSGLQPRVIPASSDDSTIANTEKYEGLDESGIDQSILDMIENETDDNKNIKNEPSPRPIFKDERIISRGSFAGNLLPALNDEESTGSELQYLMNNVIISRDEDRHSTVIHTDVKSIPSNVTQKSIEQRFPREYENTQTYHIHQDSNVKIHQPAFTRQAISNASFLFSDAKQQDTFNSQNAKALLTDDIERRISNINIEDSSKRLSGIIQHCLSEISVDELLEKARQNEEKRRHNELNRLADPKLPFRGQHNLDGNTSTINCKRDEIKPLKNSPAQLSLEIKSDASKGDEISVSGQLAASNIEVRSRKENESNHTTVDASASSNFETTEPVHGMNRSIVTPRKSHSPFIRFKSAMKHFEKPFTQDGNVTIFGKSPTRMMLSSTGFVVNTVTELNGRLRRNIQRPLKDERRLTMGNDLTIAPRRAKLVNPLFRPNEYEIKKNSIEADPSGTQSGTQCIKNIEPVPPREILCDLVNRIPNSCERRISKTIDVERLVDKVPGQETLYDMPLDQDHQRADDEIPYMLGCQFNCNEDLTASRMRLAHSSHSFSQIQQPLNASNVIEDHSNILRTECNNISPSLADSESLSCVKFADDTKLETCAATDSLCVLSKEGALSKISLEKEDVDEHKVPKLVSWSVEDLMCGQDKGASKAIDSPTEYSISLCSTTQNSVTTTNDISRSLPAQTEPSALYLSPTQRTPMQARKWRTLAAEAEAKKKSAHKKHKKALALHPKGYSDI